MTEPRKLTENEEKIMKALFERANQRIDDALYEKLLKEETERHETMLLFFCIATLLVVVSGTAYWIYEVIK